MFLSPGEEPSGQASKFKNPRLEPSGHGPTMPTWEDCQQLLQTLYMSEERERIRAQGQKLVVEPDGLPTMEVDHLEAVLPITQLRWDPNTDQGKEALERYHQTLMGALQAVAQRPTNMSKVTEVTQGATESPAAFLECLQEAYRLYTPIDLEAPENRRAINIAFIAQSAPDIRKKKVTKVRRI
ncbi:uncharacterized protein LOC119538494 isoform X2 [Choloepus didactylus]|uniref:uncharacterized protein LOC119538494 isoform X2 n=1 Tax=Choloepus didactylus TaxID=27675 RepID=UPI0018A08CCF|nr:uncharacterized protein LOC119538494 isoform X2 [Choloepus didactylus]